MQRLQLPPTLFKLLVSTGLFSSLSIAQAVTFTVTNLNDSGAGSLRQAILDANAATGSDTIQISVEGTITFLYGQMNITDNLTINGPGASQLIISGDSLSRIFSIHQGATVTLNALSLQNGKVLNVEPNDGGAIHNQGTLNINHCVLSKNNAYDKGGAIFNSGALNVRRSVLSANVAGGRGGTIYNYGATTLTESTLSDNTTGSHGGGITNYADNSKPSTLTIVSSTLSGNSANTSSGEGGGIYNQQDTSSNLARVTITNSTLSANTSNSHGGGIRNYNGTIKIYNSTISKNNAIYNGVGGGIYSTRMQAVVDLYNNVIAGNLYRGTESNIAIGEVPINHESNLFGTDGNAGLSGLTPAASDIVLPGPLSTVIDELANNGGPTQTHLPVPGSPAIDAGDNALIPADVTTDQRGFARIMGGTVDIGAVEAGSILPPADATAVGVFRSGSWFLDANGNGAWDGCQQDGGLDLCLFGAFGMTGDQPAAGHWDGGVTSSIGVLRSGTGEWFIDYNGNHQWDGCVADGCYRFGAPGDWPVAGDWTGTGFAKIGVFRNGQWYLDANGNGAWDGCGTDWCFAFGQSGDLPVAGNWNSGTQAGVGVFRAGTWYLDYNGNGTWDGCQHDGGQDQCLYNSFGMAGDLPATGDWNGDGTAKVGVFRNGTWYLDYNGNGAWDGCGIDRCYEGSFGMKGDWPVAGKW